VSDLVSGILTVRLEAADKEGVPILDDAKFDKAIADGPKRVTCVCDEATLVSVGTCENFMSRRSGHSTKKYRVHEVTVAYPIEVRITDGRSVREAAEALALFAMWSGPKGLHPEGFKVMLFDNETDIVVAGDIEDDVSP